MPLWRTCAGYRAPRGLIDFGAMKLYRSPFYPQHWVAFTVATGWVVFPAKVNGWVERRPAKDSDLTRLQEVPLWLSFHTGLLEFSAEWHMGDAA